MKHLARIRPVLVLGFVLFVGLAASLAFAAGDVEKGRAIFTGTGEDLEYPSCAHCHATVSAETELKATKALRPAYPIFNTSHRGAWKNKKPGKLKTAGDAGNICVKAFQKREKSLTPAELENLNAFFATVSPGTDVKPRKIKYAPKIPESLDGGNKDKGKTLVAQMCSVCHGPSDDHIQSELKPGRRPKMKVAMKVRGWIRDRKTKKLKFKADAGMMGFIAENRLSDAQLLDVLAYLGK
ncbi:MAG: c-type cytochrome [Planctomycetota bacterium]